jgi:hypothetical protein
MARAYPAEVGPIRELRHTLGQLRLNDLAVGSDGRNRCLLSAFASKTGRNQPSNTRFIFGPSTWLRSLIQPPPGSAVAYCDWFAQELGIAAQLSGDRVMQDAYLSGDPYLYLARRAGAVPADATKKTHPSEREQFKVVSLGVLYGLSAEGIARRLNVPPCKGRELLDMHRQTFRRFWEWADESLALAVAGGQTLRDAATVAGVSERTATRRWADAAFRRRVAELRADMVVRSVGRLADGMAEAADVLRALLTPGTPPAVRLGAARSLLELGVKLRESVEIEERLAALEAAAAVGEQQGKGRENQ